MPTELEQLVADHYAELSPELLSPLLQLIQTARLQFGGDLDKYLILLAVTMRTVEQGSFTKAAQALMNRGEAPVVPAHGINVRSIADSVEMPKETVRRKVQELIETGWIAREEDGLLYPTAKAFYDLEPLRRASARQAARYYLALSALRARLQEPD